MSGTKAVLGTSDPAQIHSSCGAAPRNSETIRMAHVPAHLLDSASKCRKTEFKVMQELLRHSTPRSTLDIYTQAVTPAKHAAQAAVVSLVFSSNPTSHSP